MVRRFLGVWSATLVIATLAHSAGVSTQDLLRDLRGREGSDFSSLIHHWQKKHGTSAVSPLLQVSRNAQLPDHERYIALLAATKLGGSAALNRLYESLEDRSWMIRSAALRGLSLLKPEARTPLQDQSLIKTLNDRALVVRREAVQAILTLQPRGSVDALLGAVSDPKNYVQGRAQWVPQSALEALESFQSPSDRAAIIAGLAPLAKRASDPKVRVAAAELQKKLAP